jgi:RimJ/RimL family protein N-acetyltransferase
MTLCGEEEVSVRVLETERLLLRPFTDADMAIHGVVFSDPEVCHFYCKNTRTEQETREWLVHRRWQTRSEDQLGFLAVIRKPDQQLLGLVALQPLAATWLRFAGTDTGTELGSYWFSPLIVELSYALGRAYQHQGYATEACAALIDYGFQEMRLPRLVNEIAPDNGPSARLCERLGFRQVPNVHPDGRGSVWILDNTHPLG